MKAAAPSWLVEGFSTTSMPARAISGALDPAWLQGRPPLWRVGQSGRQRYRVRRSRRGDRGLDDQRNGYDVYAQRVPVSGVVDPAWLSDGLGVCTEPEIEGSQAISDGSGGVIIAWGIEWD
jgi:hypothetical protein